MTHEYLKYKLMAHENGLYRIIALRDFGDVKTGDRGGFVAKEDNLSHDGDCWIYDDARVFGNARVSGKAKVTGFARVFGSAHIFRNARVHEHARVYDSATVGENARVHGRATVYGNVQVYGSASIYGESQVYEYAMVFDNTEVTGRAHICGRAQCAGGKYDQSIHIKCGIISENTIRSLLRCSIGVIPDSNGFVYLTKRVNKDLTSQHAPNFVYPTSGIVEVTVYDPNPTNSCASGLHFSNMEYWEADPGVHAVILAKIHIDDIIAIQEGKVRCKRAEVIGVSYP